MGRHSCCHKQKLKKGLWSPDEDEKLVRHITKHGHGCWSAVPKQAGELQHLAYYSPVCSHSFHDHFMPNFLRCLITISITFAKFRLNDLLLLLQVSRDVGRAAGCDGSTT
jgi:hypothetical protein